MTTDPPLVSVIMIFLDAERFIEEAIESVTSQTYQAWELVLVDDGSSDESSRIARRHADRSSGQIRYLEHEGHVNVGMSASRNAGIRVARGELIAFLDADDVYRPEKLERQVAILQRQPEAAMVYGATQHWYSWTGRSADLARDSLRRLGVAPDTLVHPPALIPLFLRLEAQTPGTCGILARRDAIERIGGFEDRFDGMFEDQVFLFKLCLSAPIFVEGGSWDRYRQHPDSFAARVRSGGEDYKQGPTPLHEAFLEWLEEYLVGRGISDSEVEAAVRRVTRPYRHPLAYRLLRRIGERRLSRLRRRITTHATPFLGAAKRVRPRMVDRG